MPLRRTPEPPSAAVSRRLSLLSAELAAVRDPAQHGWPPDDDAAAWDDPPAAEVHPPRDVGPQPGREQGEERAGPGAARVALRALAAALRRHEGEEHVAPAITPLELTTDEAGHPAADREPRRRRREGLAELALERAAELGEDLVLAGEDPEDLTTGDAA